MSFVVETESSFGNLGAGRRRVGEKRAERENGGTGCILGRWQQKKELGSNGRSKKKEKKKKKTRRERVQANYPSKRHPPGKKKMVLKRGSTGFATTFIRGKRFGGGQGNWNKTDIIEASTAAPGGLSPEKVQG